MPAISDQDMNAMLNEESRVSVSWSLFINQFRKINWFENFTYSHRINTLKIHVLSAMIEKKSKN